MKYDRALNIDSIASTRLRAVPYIQCVQRSTTSHDEKEIQRVWVSKCEIERIEIERDIKWVSERATVAELMFTFYLAFFFLSKLNALKDMVHKHVSNTPVITNITQNSSFSIPLLLLSFAYCNISLFCCRCP